MKRTGLAALLWAACVILMAGCATPSCSCDNGGGFLSRFRLRRRCCDPCPCALSAGAAPCEGGLCAGSGGCGDLCCDGPLLGDPSLGGPVPGLAPVPGVVPPISAPPGRLSPEPPTSAQPTPAGPVGRRK